MIQNILVPSVPTCSLKLILRPRSKKSLHRSCVFVTRYALYVLYRTQGIESIQSNKTWH
jgi:hypothetical protein